MSAVNRDLRGRIALVTLHTSPLDRPGTGDSGGLNVYVREVATRLGARGVLVDVFTRCAGRGIPVEELAPGVRVIEVHAGPCAPVPKEGLPELAPEFAAEVLRTVETEGAAYDLVQAHYWLSGLVGAEVARRWDIPLLMLFHTLARVKNLSVREGESPEPEARASAEGELASAAARVVVPTETEARYLCDLYGVDASRVRLAPPGVDTERFRPFPGAEARRRLGLDEDACVALVAGRLQPLKGPDLAIRAVAEALAMDPKTASRLTLVVVGEPRAGSEDLARLRAEAAELDIADRVVFLEAVAHDEMPSVFSVADVVLMPSRSESFGLVALEAQACGVPVVASSVGGLRHTVVEGETGFLVPPGDPSALADRMLAVLGDAEGRSRMSRAARRRAERFSWDATVAQLVSVYEEVCPGVRLDSPSSDREQLVTLPPNGF